MIEVLCLHTFQGFRYDLLYFSRSLTEHEDQGFVAKHLMIYKASFFFFCVREIHTFTIMLCFNLCILINLIIIQRQFKDFLYYQIIMYYHIIKNI